MSLFVNVLREGLCSAGLQEVFLFRGICRGANFIALFLFPSWLSQDADETQGESLKDELTPGTPTTDSQVGWSFLSLS